MAVFVAVVEEGSFRKAGERLGLSPSVISHHVSTLERRLGVRLLERSSRSITLTEHGAALYQPARKMLAAGEQGLRAISVPDSVPSGELRVALVRFLACGTEALFDEFLRQHPKVSLDLRFETDQREPVRGACDLVVHLERRPSGEILVEPLPPVPFVLVAAADLAERVRGASPQEIGARLPLLRTRCLPRDFWDRFLPVANGRPRVRASCDDMALARELCRLGLGVAALPRMIAGPDIRAGALVELQPGAAPPSVPLHAHLPRERRDDPLVRAFLDHLSDFLAAQAG